MSGRLALAFTAGMVATVNPCGFALLPAYLTYFLGLENDAASQPGGRYNPVRRALAVSAAVTLGFVAVFGVMGLVWSSFAEVVGQRLPYATFVIGLGLVAVGIAMLRGYEPVVRLPMVQLSGEGRELTSMFLYGVSYAVASLSCTIGVFISVVSTTLAGEHALTSLATFLAYALGMGVTLAVLTLGVALARQGVVHTFRRLLPYMHRISGVLMVVAGVFVAYYAWVEIGELESGRTSTLVGWSRDVQSAVQRWTERMGAGRLALAGLVVLSAAAAVSLVARSDRGPANREVQDDDAADGALDSGT
ncbi:MAG: cytochrome c biogenesis CcdA family protein [Actinomycetes bacterium]